ncbi:MAG: type III polyketide synthase [Actinomycetales bacterium]|nr:type III polyketide synthase [Actinomycetales bacterium]
MSRIVAVAPVVGAHAYPQEEITATIAPLLTADPARRALLERLHAASGVRTRHLALPLAEYAGLTTFRDANDAFIRVGTRLAADAAHAALDRAGLRPADVDYVFFTSVTGVAAPSLDALLVAELGLRPDVRRLPSFGLGCAGGAAGLGHVHDHLLAHPDHAALLVSVELCSLTIQHGDDSTANLVASGIFGDGGAAVVMVGAAHPAAHPAGRPTARPTHVGGGACGPVPAVVDAATRTYPGTADQLGWTVGGSGFGIVLAPGLPDVVRAHLADDVRGLLEPHDLKPRDVGAWVVHAGGPRILDAVQEALDLDDEALHATRASFADAGNLSSASVLHVLAATLDAPHQAGEWGVALAFGPGVGAELVLLRWG